MLTKGSGTTVPFLESLAAQSGRPVMIAALLHNSTRPEQAFEELAEIGAAQGRGRRLYGQVSCCPLTMDFTLHSPYLFEGLPGWKPAAAVKADLESSEAVRLFNGEWDKLNLLEAATDQYRELEHRDLAELAAMDGKHPLDWMLDCALNENLDTIFTAVLLNSDEAAVGRMLRDPYASIALSDAGAHLTFFCDAGFGLYLMGHWSRGLGVLPLEEAVWQLTGRPAEIFGIPERGRLAPGYAADLLLFDPATVGRGAKQRVHDLPGGAPRLTTPAVGVRGVWVNGAKVADETGALAGAGRRGQVLREFGG
jgi:N-acyl-D-aspartate/D-glutamate deacylase